MRPKLLNILEPWDWLIVLDACRYDFFVKNWNLGHTEPRLSPDSCTLGFLNHLPRIPDAVVVTSHPFVFNYRHKFGSVIDAGWDDKLGTCPPWLVTETLMRRWDVVIRYRRKILWFLQPHHPFIGETKLNVTIFDDKRWGNLTPMQRQVEMYRRAYREGILWKAYEDNLRLVLREVRRLINHLSGVVVITADHGDGLGKPLRPEDKPVFAHPCGREEWEVRLVPWCVIAR